ncbi:hypothetical protein [uncultured Methanobacterium sp.]|uniref:hypothetical protein n=1 Tax=uncultured Methanobacterium sp. TaxID=176306 RepID=UPI002AA75198|nr:hypothetical protein [uncultured Methanobacterium sp.]
MDKNNILNVGIVGIFILIVLASGCTSSSSTETKTFSEGVMIFNYPADFDNGTYSADDTNSSITMQEIGKLENTAPLRTHSIMIYRNISAISPAEARDKAVSAVNNMSTGEVLSVNTETNPNGIVIEETTYKNEPIFGIKVRFCEMFFKVNDSVYRISVYGPETNIGLQNIKSTTAIIFQSIK